ncbi:hypothetical protein L249_2152 [Ophiocordyceps polyrhachis-furcata BCC 54312]|uniref:Serine/threonine-protein kinase ppk6 n=1 Tax=Ophiocordyceps polyrhachis-furcata BCC 54312 TaxID=1330021 RepID=A0A367LPH5_9HYPO|nr:hypothetical protein L249_2152 [Ophiocordyceps polyrhachis-furcata BCC 54312]
MSADLFAEFSKPSKSTGQEREAAAAPDDDDGWGDFETAEPVITPAVKQPPPARTVVNNGIGKRPPLILDTTRPKAQAKAALASPHVLFDVDDFELQTGDIIDDDDDFGDFTSAPQSCINTTATPSLDLLALEESPASHQSARQETTGKKPSFGAPLPARSSNSSKQKPSSALDLLNDMSGATSFNLASNSNLLTSSAATEVIQTTVEDGDGDWAAWDDHPAPAPSAGPATVREQSPDGWAWDAEDSGKPLAEDSSNKPPPTNVPPPWVILSTFPELFSSGTPIFKSLMGQSVSVQEQILMKPKAVQFLQCYILLATTAARVLAGRKHRWQRDKMLAKGMSLSAVGSKGMKLTGVDKTQTSREDREAAEVVASWREHVGRLRAAVATANSCNETKLKMPELSNKMQIHTAKMVPTAPTACVICGLKRDERIVKVDFEVEDSFGEWWVDHWGHRACKNFWLEHEPRLRQR